MPTVWTAELLGVKKSDIRGLSISKPRWWGLSEFDSEIPLIHVPHWGYYNTHHRLSDEQWNEVIEATRRSLGTLGFS